MKSHQKYGTISFWMTLPVIIISTITGTANFAHGTFPDSWSDTTPLVIGAFNLVAGIITTIAQFMRVNERNEAHRAAALAYDKLCNTIQEELNLPANERTMSGLEMIEKVRVEFERLLEQSPTIDQQIAMKFEGKFIEWFGDLNSAAKSSMAKPSLLDIREIRVFDPKSLPPPFLPAKVSPKPVTRPKPDVSNFMEIAASEAAAATAQAARSAAEAEIAKLRKSMTPKTFIGSQKKSPIPISSMLVTNELGARRLSDVVADAVGAVEIATGAVAQVADDVVEELGARTSPAADLSISVGRVQLDVDAVVHVDSSEVHEDTYRESAEVSEAVSAGESDV